MQADLEFEYPQKMEKIMVKNNILQWLDDEEEKLKNIALTYALEKDAAKQQMSKVTPGDEFHLTIDDYFGNKDTTGRRSGLAFGSFRPGEDKIAFDTWVEQNASKNIFDNDLLESQYKFWESDEDREVRLKRTWLEMHRRQALGGVDAMQTEEQLELTEQIVELMRKVRWKVDQELVRHNE